MFKFRFLFSAAFICIISITTSIAQVKEPVRQLRGSLQYAITTEETPLTAIAVVASSPIIATIVTSDQSTILPLDPDAPDYTYFFSLPSDLQNQDFELRVSNDEANIYFIDSGQIPIITSSRDARESSSCDDPPPMILQSEWRVGLDAPQYSRSFHEVKHIIVHHSAGSNTASNFTQVVRDIYLFHTQVNGWSDIGYNYLISQDGTLYAGRDPGTGEQSRVRGAHFCGANTGTMGICLLGNYETAQPSPESLLTLNELLTFEAITQELDPLQERRHSTGLLGTIAGHQDGCATLCPGEHVYSRLDDIRQTVFNAKIQCEGGQILDFAFDHELLGVDQPLVLANQSQGYSDYQWLIDEVSYPIENKTYTFDRPGTYDLGIIGYFSDQSDTLVFSNAVKVSWLLQEPIIFPNPSPDRKITIDYRPEIVSFVLRDLHGKIVFEQTYEGAQLELPASLEGGVYHLEIITLEGVSTSSKIILQ